MKNICYHQNRKNFYNISTSPRPYSAFAKMVCTPLRQIRSLVQKRPKEVKEYIAMLKLDQILFLLIMGNSLSLYRWQNILHYSGEPKASPIFTLALSEKKASQSCCVFLFLIPDTMKTNMPTWEP